MLRSSARPDPVGNWTGRPHGPVSDRASNRTLIVIVLLLRVGGIDRQLAGPERDLLHERLRILLLELVVHGGHGAVRAVPQPRIHDPLRDPRVHGERLEKMSQRVQRETAVLPSRRQAQLADYLLELL